MYILKDSNLNIIVESVTGFTKNGDIWVYDGGAIIDYDFTLESPIVVPVSITKLQAMRAMKQALIWTSFNTALQTNTDALDEWNLSPLVYRNNVFVVALAAALGLTDVQLDDLFILGESL